ncbi:MAG TPA: 1-deoxy-D-xylulose-5-phosphate synthase [Flavobacteriaceae bacterium]|nr:1-deoxy-D-xylulose-5-phosphate synthase [Flavobacteriaceae bacterium]
MGKNILKKINSPEKLRILIPDELPEVAQELRDFIIDVVSTKEGHLGASLGVVELTIALHYVFKTPDDLLVWDVGHQAYGHKILTGRQNIFETNRKLNGISGFPKRKESQFDTFGTGHSSTSISAALGMALASQLKGDFEKQHIAVVGDASIASGMAFEGLNHAGVTDANLLVILNDNSIGIDPSVGALKEYLVKTKPVSAAGGPGEKPKQGNIFEALNFKYKGPVDGHNLQELLAALNELKSIKGPKFLHVITKKGKGLLLAEKDQVKYHAPGKFDKKTGILISKDDKNLPPKYQDVFGWTILELAEKNEKIIGITPAMPTGSSLKYMMNVFPERAFDVGIAEQHAVTLSAGMATQGFVVFCAIYSTFLQRGYDQLIHDVALQDLPVIFCVDRAGLVGEDGPTHHGIFDLAYLRCIPNMIVAAPSSEVELRNILFTASFGLKHPIAIRYPRGRGRNLDWRKPFEMLEIGKGRKLKDGKKIAILSVGTISANISEAIENLDNPSQVAHYDMRFVKPLDYQLVDEIFAKYKLIFTAEDGCVKGGFGDELLEYSASRNYSGKIVPLGIPDHFITHGTVEELQDLAGISAAKIQERIERHL